jgi:hypothetical protein
MLTISSIGVMPWPQQTPTTKAQPVTATKTSNAVSPENARPGAAVVSAGDATQVQATYAPSALPPVDPASEALAVVTYSNAQVPERGGQVSAQQVQSASQREDADRVNDAQAEQAAAQTEEQVSSNRSTDPQVAQEQSDEIRRFKGELPVEYKSPVQEALDTQINDLLPNMWAASRAAVDVLIGEEARAAAAARAADVAEKTIAQVPAAADKSAEVSETYAAGQAATGTSRTPGQVVNVQA